MKKKIITAILVTAMSASLLTACGGDNGAKETTTAQKTETQEPAKAADTTPADDAGDADDADNAVGEMVSDETFATLQDNYKLVQEYVEQVKEVYSMDEIAADPEIEDLLNQGDDIMSQLAAISQDELTEESAVELNNTMKELLEGYIALVGAMEVVDNDADAAGGEMVSDETFAALSEAYDELTQIYNTVAEAYNASGAEDADIKAAMDEAYDYLEQMGQITQDSITEEDAQTLAQSMLTALEVLSVVAENL